MTTNDCIKEKNWKGLAKLMAKEIEDIKRAKENKRMNQIIGYEIDKGRKIKLRKR